MEQLHQSDIKPVVLEVMSCEEDDNKENIKKIMNGSPSCNAMQRWQNNVPKYKKRQEERDTQECIFNIIEHTCSKHPTRRRAVTHAG